MAEVVSSVIGFVVCLAIIITLTIAVCYIEAENARLRRENRLLRRVLKDYQRLEQAGLDAYAALERETQRQMGNSPF